MIMQPSGGDEPPPIERAGPLQEQPLSPEAVAALDRLDVAVRVDELGHASQAIEAADQLAKDDWEVGSAMLRHAATSQHPRVRLWAACLLGEAAGADVATYLDVAADLVNDEDEKVRTAVKESLLFYEPHPRILWKDIQSIISRIR
jgi:hypothetical protein